MVQTLIVGLWFLVACIYQLLSVGFAQTDPYYLLFKSNNAMMLTKLKLEKHASRYKVSMYISIGNKNRDKNDNCGVVFIYHINILSMLEWPHLNSWA